MVSVGQVALLVVGAWLLVAEAVAVDDFASESEAAMIKLTRRATARHRRGGSLIQDDNANVSLTAQRGGVAVWKNNVEVFLALAIGNPPRIVRAQIDTGSSVSVVPGVECFTTADTARRCGGYLDVPYSRESSSTAAVKSGNVSVRFADGSELRGFVVQDDAAFVMRGKTSDALAAAAAGGGGDNASATAVVSRAAPFGFIYVTEANDAAREGMADVGAILGLGPDAFAEGADPTRPSVLRLFENRKVFSLAIGLTPPRFFIGVPPVLAESSKLRYTPMTQQYSTRLKSAYSVIVDSIAFGFSSSTADIIGGGPSPSPPLGDVILDSGTSFLLFPSDVFRNFMVELKRFMFERVGLEAAFVDKYFSISEMGEAHLNLEQYRRIRPALPPMLLSFGGFFVVIPPSKLFVEAPCSLIAKPLPSELTCFGLAVGNATALPGRAGTVDPAPITLLGDPFMSALAIVFDNERKQIGLFPAVPGSPYRTGERFAATPTLPRTGGDRATGSTSTPAARPEEAQQDAADKSAPLIAVALLGTCAVLIWVILRWRRQSTIGGGSSPAASDPQAATASSPHKASPPARGRSGYTSVA